MAIEFSAAVSRIPVYPAAAAYALPEDVALLASNESPEPPLEPVVAAITAILTGVNRYPDPTNAKLRAALSDRYEVPASRIAIGNGSCDILLAAGEALLEPGAELVYAWPSFSVYPHLAAATGATQIQVPLNEAHEHDLDAMLREITAATRLVIVCNPNNPTSTAVAAGRHRRVRRQGPRARLRPARRGLLRVQHARRSRRLAGSPQEAPQLGPAAHVQQGVRVVRAARRLRAVRLRRLRHRRQPGPPAVLLQRRRAGRSDRVAQHGDAVAQRVERAIVARLEIEDGLGELGIVPAASQANFAWFDLPVGTARSPARSRRPSSRAR